LINPMQCLSYLDYLALCKAENEVPADEATWGQWKYPTVKVDAPTLEQRVTELERRMNEWEAGK
jgi:hypothetical protein